MKRLLILALMMPLLAQARHQILAPNFKSLHVVLNSDFTSLPIINLNSRDVLHISFDELSHDYHRLTYHLEPCNPDWTPADGLFDSDWLEGFNDRPIEEYRNSLNTNVLYTHYSMQIPNADTRLKMSGNYRLHIVDEDASGEEVIVVEFRVAEQLMDVALGISANTDVDLNASHQQATMSVGFGRIKVSNVEEQIQTFVIQNGREDNMRVNVKPSYVTTTGLRWEHNREMIFDAGNEYHKFEVLDPTHTTMGLDRVYWMQDEGRFHAVPYAVEPRRSYIYDVDADGAFLLRNSDNYEAQFTSEYVLVHYRARVAKRQSGNVIIDGWWTNEPIDNYIMQWNETDDAYEATVMQKLGYYNYQLLAVDEEGAVLLPEEGSFYQTENLYTALVYYKGAGERSWRLVGRRDTMFKTIKDR
jgi:hypothetical protein